MLSDIKIQQYYPNQHNRVYLDTPSLGLISSTGVDLMNEFTRSLYLDGSIRSEAFLQVDLPRIRKKIGSFLEAELDEIALIPNFSFGLNALIPALKKYRNVLLLEGDYPSLTQPFVLNDFEIAWVHAQEGFYFDLNRIQETIEKKKIKVVAVSEVQYLTGYCMDIEALGNICKNNGTLLIVDGTQSLGAIPYSFRHSSADIYITSNYKWMNAGLGTGIMLLKSDFLASHEPMIGGFGSFIQKDGEWKYAPSIASYEPGHMNMGGYLILEDAMDIKMKLGIKNIHRHNKELLDLLLNGLEHLKVEIIGPYDNKYRSSIVCLKDEVSISSALKKHNIISKTRNDAIRLGLHFYNTEADIQKIIEALETVS